MKYIVEIPWAGVKKGQLVEFEKLHPSLKANVKPFIEVNGGDENELQLQVGAILQEARDGAALIISDAESKAKEIIAAAEAKAGSLVPATPEATSEKLNINLEDKDQVKAKLKELNIEFDGRSSLEDLVALLPA
ncbi:hypothetical protein [Vibrio cholerae]|uniref:hypothetical protein n=1 Tax=Vibrio cholerae TaxID=666 RepID=UPI002271A9C9|nr:hypothetical protein [Vibrio cholerae]MCX9579848.1 hypothetical protein [Vibrio cholerae]